MAKTLLYRLFGAGRVPNEIIARIDEEKLVFVEEGIPVIFAFDNYRAPGKRFKNKITGISGYICLTKKGLYGPTYGRISLGIQWIDPRISSFRFEVVKEKLVVRFETSLMDDKAEGLVEYRFKCSNPKLVLQQIEQIK